MRSKIQNKPSFREISYFKLKVEMQNRPLFLYPVKDAQLETDFYEKNV